MTCAFWTWPSPVRQRDRIWLDGLQKALLRPKMPVPSDLRSPKMSVPSNREKKPNGLPADCLIGRQMGE